MRLKRRLTRGAEVLLPYGWTGAAWAEIESGVVGLCAYESHGPGGAMGAAGGQYITELLSVYEGLGISTRMLSLARRHGEKDGEIELQVHEDNTASEFYERLGFRRARWWGRQPGGGRRLEPQGGRSLTEPLYSQAMWRAGGGALDEALRSRGERRGAPTGVRYVEVEGIQGLHVGCTHTACSRG